MNGRNKAEAAMLEARLEDYLSRSDRGEVAVSRFLSPGEKKRSEKFLSARGAEMRAVFWGGYAGAERECLFLAPDFYIGIPDLMPQAGSAPVQLVADDEDDAVAAVRVSGSGYRKLTHRDYLGSLLGLGLERDALGDIAVQNECEAVVFCQRRLVRFLLENLNKVASDAVRCRDYTPDRNFTDGRRYEPVCDTVASARLDCVVAALTGLSREEAKSTVLSGLVEVDFEPEERCDRTLCAPVSISVRGHGRFILRAFDGETRKGRLRLRADRLV